MTDFNVDPELLEDGEHVLWATKGLEGNKRGALFVFGWTILGLLGALFLVYSNFQSLKHFTEVWTNPEVWRVLGIGGLAIAITLMIQRWAVGKGWISEEQSEFYVGLITNQRLVVFSADHIEEIVLLPGQVKAVNFDYSNGARALSLELTSDAPMPHVTISSAGDIDTAKRMIESGFIDAKHAGATR